MTTVAGVCFGFMVYFGILSITEIAMAYIQKREAVVAWSVLLFCITSGGFMYSLLEVLKVSFN